ncbi:DUF4919 domain-containing protein [Burkholderia perseverans]|uniref:DUF4919 domain-containing protein n=1 Tax=Burkholderia perseverans TaxID=2615214 RepID=UPI001FED4636|nr:DUF4919 domain-containing protein [Burkholderia perseverans]
MRKTKWLACLLLFLSAGNQQAWAVAPPDINPATIDALQAQRQHFGDGAQVDPQQLARDVQAAIADAVALDRVGNAAGAIGRLEQLKKYAPLDQFPDIDVQTLCGGLYQKLLKIDLGNACHDRAQALAEILKNRSGGGTTPDDPVRVVMVREIGEWVRLRRGTVKAVEAQQSRGNELQKVSYSTPGADGTTSAYFLVDPRVMAATMRQRSTFDPLPIDAGADNPYAKALRQAHEQRLQFLADRSFDYPVLMQLCHDTEAQAMKLAQQGDFDGALATMQAIEKIRPIRQIPNFNVISVYSYLLGKTGHLSEQAEMRLFLFGITQDIAHSGDGLSTATAIHVVSDDEEYTWLASRHLRLTKQALLENGASRYDELSTVDANGHAQPPYYFEVSQAYVRQSPVPVQ